MRESIICIGQIATVPYRFPETGVSVFSYEEICYYISNHMLFYLYTLPEENLLFYMRDALGLEKLYRQLCRLTDPDKDQMKYFSALFREGNYFSEEEIHKILDEYRELKNASYPLQCKWTGDLYVTYKRASMAIHYYKEALKFKTLDQGSQGAVYHNMAVAKSRLFRFQDAKIDFLKAYQQTGEEESLFGYYSLVAWTEGIMTAAEELKSFQVSEILLESFENRFAAATDDFNQTDQAAKHRRIEFLEENERREEAQTVYQKFVRQLQKDFRQELDVDENLMVTNLPISYTL